jgi:hypothetical protein
LFREMDWVVDFVYSAEHLHSHKCVGYGS